MSEASPPRLHSVLSLGFLERGQGAQGPEKLLNSSSCNLRCRGFDKRRRLRRGSWRCDVTTRGNNLSRVKWPFVIQMINYAWQRV